MARWACHTHYTWQDRRAGGKGQRRNPPWAGGGRGERQAPQTWVEAEAGQRARLSPGESSPPLAAAATAPRRGPALPGRWAAGWRHFLAPSAAGQTWLWLSRACSGTRHQQTLALALGAHAPSQPPKGTGGEGKSSFLPSCGPPMDPLHREEPSSG